MVARVLQAGKSPHQDISAREMQLSQRLCEHLLYRLRKQRGALVAAASHQAQLMYLSTCLADFTSAGAQELPAQVQSKCGLCAGDTWHRYHSGSHHPHRLQQMDAHVLTCQLCAWAQQSGRHLQHVLPQVLALSMSWCILAHHIDNEAAWQCCWGRPPPVRGWRGWRANCSSCPAGAKARSASCRPALPQRPLHHAVACYRSGHCLPSLGSALPAQLAQTLYRDYIRAGTCMTSST